MTSVSLSVPHIRQRKDGECMAASAAMVLAYMRFPHSYKRLLRLLRIK